MKLRKWLITLGIAIVAPVTLAGCAGGLSNSQRQAKTQIMKYTNGSGRDIISSNSFNGSNNTDDITFTKKEAARLNAANTLNMQARQGNSKLRKQAMKQMKKNASQISYSNSEVKGLATTVHQAAVTSGDKNMKLHITNSRKKYPTLTLLQAQVQPSKKEQTKQLNALQNKERSAEMSKFNSLEQQQKNKIMKKAKKQGATKSQMNQVSKKVDQQIAKQEKIEHNRLYKPAKK